MAQPSANREEPTMEDILSSIRRIIQTNDEQASEQEAASDRVVEVAQQEGSSESGAASDEASISEAVEALESELLSESGPTEAGDVQSPAPSSATEAVQPTPEVPRAEVDDMSQDVIDQQHESEIGAQVESVEYGSARDEKSKLSAEKSLGPLMSADSSAKIAASFADLTSALSEHSSANLEDMTRDIVRPLVTEWLDNNLPSMVERMVREEIERVARGG